MRKEVGDIYDMLGGIHATLADDTAALDQHTAALTDQGTKLDQIIGMLER